jgi:general L-amino acid transport system permease protein
LAVTLGFFLLCLVRLTVVTKPYFDEIHYLPAARAVLVLSQPLNPEHPPLGKEILALGIALFGDGPLGWRIMPALFGTLGLFAAMRALWFASLSRFATIACGVLLATAFPLFVQSRIAMLDIFMASFMLPLFVPPGVTFDKFLRALIGVALFASAYMAEVVRGGLQAIPKGQYEGADSLGLGYWQKTGLIIMPQALKLVIPGIVNTFIGMFKDTTLVLIIGMFDLLGMVQAASTSPEWLGYSMEGYVAAGLIYWIFCFGMSRYSAGLEHRLDTSRSQT